MSSSTLRKLLALPIVLILFWIGGKYLLPIFAPFLLAALLALAAEPIVSFLEKRSHLKRGVAAAIGVSITLVILLLVIMVLVALLIRQLGNLSAIVPDLEGTAQQGLGALEQWLLNLAEQTPQAVRPLVTQGVTGIFSDGSALINQLTGKLLGLASSILGQLPDSVLGIGTWLLACYMLSGKLPRISQWLQSRLPDSFHQKYIPMLKQAKRTVSGWFLAQAKLMGVTFCVLCAGFLALQITYAPVWAAVISLVDALPVLGTGMVLVPWTVVCFLQGETVRAVGLLGIWAAASLVRSVLEPRVVGKQLGLDPLVTLIAIYAGYRLWGFLGMILAPLIAVTLAGFFSMGNTGKEEKKPL